MTSSDIRQVSEKRTIGGEHWLPPKWRLAVSARPAFWCAMNTANCHEYRVLSKRGEAIVKYHLGDESSARYMLDELIKRVETRKSVLDKEELPLLYWCGQ